MANRRGNREGSIYKRGAGYEGQVMINGRRRTFNARMKREVQQKIREAVGEAERGILPGGENLTVAAFLQRWLAAV